MSLSKVVEIARGELGVTENPSGSNLTKYGFWYGVDGVPWCVIFLCWLFDQAGERMAFFGGGKTASCGTLLRWYREQGLTVDVSDIDVGDIVLMDFSGGGSAEHCGLVVEKGPLAGTWYTIEGNTTPGEEGSQDNGGCVAMKLRSVRNIVGVCRPQYKPEEPHPVDDVSGHWAASSIKWAKERGIIKGYPDGSFQPDKPVTRAEMCVILERFYAQLYDDTLV